MHLTITSGPYNPYYHLAISWKEQHRVLIATYQYKLCLKGVNL